MNSIFNLNRISYIMKISGAIKITGILLILTAFIPHNVSAQNEVLRQQHSLYGIQEMGVVINVEKPLILQSLEVDVSEIRLQLLENLQEIPVTILNDTVLQKSDQHPILHLHINILDGTPGVYSFASDLRFYQPVSLILNNDLGTMASTWHNGSIGVVSSNAGEYIKDESVKLVHAFIRDYESVNE